MHFGGRNKNEFESLANSLVELPERDDDGGKSRPNSLPKWKLVWRKLKREKKKMFESTTSVLSRNHNNHRSSPYDEYNYTQNFDQGTSTFRDDEHDILARSFSVRFSDPSSVFKRNE